MVYPTWIMIYIVIFRQYLPRKKVILLDILLLHILLLNFLKKKVNGDDSFQNHNNQIWYFQNFPFPFNLLANSDTLCGQTIAHFGYQYVLVYINTGVYIYMKEWVSVKDNKWNSQINRNNHIIEWKIWENIPFCNRTTSILFHTSTLILGPQVLPS